MDKALDRVSPYKRARILSGEDSLPAGDQWKKSGLFTKTFSKEKRESIQRSLISVRVFMHHACIGGINI